MQLPNYWLTRPGINLEQNARTDFDDLLNDTRKAGGCPAIDYALPWPKWAFLCHIAENHQIVLHGSGNAEIKLFEPHQPIDVTEFGSQRAIYAAADGLWAMYFAIVDRDRYPMSLANACIRIIDQSGQTTDPYYVFSISKSQLPLRPWREGTVYLLPSAGFVLQEPIPAGEVHVQTAQLVSLEAVAALAKLEVKPTDFPFLSDIRGHDDERLADYAAAMQSGGDWPDDRE